MPAPSPTTSTVPTEALPEQATRPAVLAAWLAQVEAAMEARPGDAALARRRADLLRALGRLEAAAAAYDALADRGLAALLRGEATAPAVVAGPARYLRIENALDPDRYRDLWALVSADQPLSPAQVGQAEKARRNTGMRDAAVIDDDASLRPWFLARVQDLVERECVTRRLGVADFAVGRGELQVTRHLDGGFFRAHRDIGATGGPAAARRLTYVYYFHRTPRRFTGGDLLLCDQDPEGRRAAQLGFTRLEPMDNSLVFFASDRLHAVTPVVMASDDPLDGRWTVNGWLHTA